MVTGRKIKNEGTLIDFFVRIECSIVFAIYFFTIFEQNTVVSVCIALNFLIITAMTMMSFFGTGEIKIFFIWFFTIGISLLSVVVTGYALSFDYMKKWIMFASTVNMFFWVSNSDISEDMIKSLKKTASLIALLFVFAYIIEKTGISDTFNGALTFNFSNPNFTAISILPISFYMFILASEYKTKLRGGLFLTLALILIWFVWQTTARACILAVIAFFVMLIFCRKYSRIVTFMVVIFPLAFAVIYMKLIDTEFMSWFEILESEGKALNSRERIWGYVFAIIKRNPGWGNYYIATNGSGLANLHNIHLDTIASYGSIVFAFTVWIMMAVLNKIGEGVRKWGMVGISAFYAIIFSGTFEAALFSGSQGVYFLVGGFLMMAKYYKKQRVGLIKETEQKDRKDEGSHILDA